MADAAPWSPPVRLPDHPYRFTPVPRASSRRDGWSSDRQHAFVAALARLPSVAKAAASVGMKARSAYRLRAAPGAEAFAQASDDALDFGLHQARDTALDRAIDGVEVPIVRRGSVIGTRRRHNDRLLIATLVNATGEANGLLVHQRAIEHRRQVRAADERLGGPADWGLSAAERLAAEARLVEQRTRELEQLLARPRPADPQRRRPQVRGL